MVEVVLIERWSFGGLLVLFVRRDGVEIGESSGSGGKIHKMVFCVKY